jgi:signal transduction histidine kinase
MDTIAPKMRASVPFRAVLISIVALWATYFTLASIRWAVIADHDALEMMQLRAIVTIAGISITFVLWLLLRLFDARPLWMKVCAALVLALPFAVLMAHVNNSVFSNMNEKMEEKVIEKVTSPSDNLFDEVPGGASDPTATITQEQKDAVRKNLKAMEKEAGFWARITDMAFSRYFMILAWCAIYFSMVATAQAREAEQREQLFKSAAKAAELRSLRYQVNPHFLFNTLNSLSALVMTGKAERAERMIQTISSFYRHSLTNEPTMDVPLEQEFELQRHYLNIEEVRFPERLKTHFDLPDDLADARIPGMILQPLVENSVKYAVSSTNRPISVTLAAREELDRLVIAVTDDGPGVPEGAEHGFGIGLANVRDRLEARFGSDVSLQSGPVEGGYRSEINVPLTRNG